ncbi:unnamed protein product [Schistosoma curassoni]|uniref:Sulfotransfer_1 domain-containing protein n=1 Tax=Schistosoma curassoni TaxID=6186 RepID=A0A183L1I0_9TREM|nr:unnamed protein product [Schistosoma curassoni]
MWHYRKYVLDSSHHEFILDKQWKPEITKNVLILIEYSTNPIVSKSLADTNPSIEIINRFSYQSNISKSSIDHVFERSSKPNSLYFIRPTQHAIDM